MMYDRTGDNQLRDQRMLVLRVRHLAASQVQLSLCHYLHSAMFMVEGVSRVGGWVKSPSFSFEETSDLAIYGFSDRRVMSLAGVLR